MTALEARISRHAAYLVTHIANLTGADEATVRRELRNGAFAATVGIWLAVAVCAVAQFYERFG